MKTTMLISLLLCVSLLAGCDGEQDPPQAQVSSDPPTQLIHSEWVQTPDEPGEVFVELIPPEGFDGYDEIAETQIVPSDQASIDAATEAELQRLEQELFYAEQARLQVQAQADALELENDALRQSEPVIITRPTHYVSIEFGSPRRRPVFVRPQPWLTCSTHAVILPCSHCAFANNAARTSRHYRSRPKPRPRVVVVERRDDRDRYDRPTPARRKKNANRKMKSSRIDRVAAVIPREPRRVVMKTKNVSRPAKVNKPARRVAARRVEEEKIARRAAEKKVKADARRHASQARQRVRQMAKVNKMLAKNRQKQQQAEIKAEIARRQEQVRANNKPADGESEPSQRRDRSRRRNRRRKR